MKKLFTFFLALAASVGTMFANQVWPIIMDETTFATCNSNSAVVADFRPNNDDRFLYLWNNTYDSLTTAGLNSMENTDGYLSLRVTGQGWAGAGFCLTDNGNSWQAAEQLRAAIVANPDNYYLHMAIKSTDNYSHCFYLFGTETTKFELGNRSVYGGPIYSDFTRDGEWQEFYIPMSTYASALASVTCSAETNIFVMQSEGVSGAMLDLDAVYICDKEFKNTFIRLVQIGDLYYHLHTTNQTAGVAINTNIGGELIIPSLVTYNDTTYSVTSIESSAFSGCTGLTSVTIPNSVTSIGGGAFYGCTGLVSMTIPNSVTSIGREAFGTVFNIVYNGTAAGSPWGARYVNGYLDGYLVYSDETKTILLACFPSVEGEIVIPNSVTSIGDGAFYGCTGLTSVIWNAKNYPDCDYHNTPFYSDGYYYGDYWDELKFDLRPQITSFTFGNEVEHIPAYLCNGMSNLTSVTIPNSVTSIGNRAFENCNGLTSVTIPNSVTSIGTCAFVRCSGLTSITIPNSVTSIGESAFAVCSNLKSLKVLNPNVEYSGAMPIAHSQMDSLRTIIVPAQCLPINPEYTAYTYYYPQQLDTIEITGGELSKEAWWMISLSRKTLQSVDLSGTAHTDLADEAFKEFYNLQKLILPANLTHIGYKSVAECVKLQSIDIPASVEEIDDRAFEDCRSLKSITFGGSANPAPGRFNAPAAASQLKRIGNWAFYNAHELQNLVIPEGVTEIGDGAFYGCTYLEDLTLPSSVQAIGDNCFALCSKLTKIIVNSVTPPTIQAKTFYDVKRQIPVYVPDEVVAQYENDPLWGEFDIQGVSEMPEGIETIESQESIVDSRKIIRDGQVFILRGEKVYTLQGQEVR